MVVAHTVERQMAVENSVRGPMIVGHRLKGHVVAGRA
jgi:hypothetical protein